MMFVMSLESRTSTIDGIIPHVESYFDSFATLGVHTGCASSNFDPILQNKSLHQHVPTHLCTVLTCISTENQTLDLWFSTAHMLTRPLVYVKAMLQSRVTMKVIVRPSMCLCMR